jgi:hypothetical protein
MEHFTQGLYRLESMIFILHITGVYRHNKENKMLPNRKPTKYLISVEEIEAKFKGKYHFTIDNNLNKVIVAILRDRADRLIPTIFRDTSLDVGGLGSHLNAWIKENIDVPEHIDTHEELLELVDDVSYLFECYDVFKGKLVRVYETGHRAHVYVNVICTINDYLVELYKGELIKLIKGEVTNPLQSET